MTTRAYCTEISDYLLGSGLVGNLVQSGRQQLKITMTKHSVQSDPNFQLQDPSLSSVSSSNENPAPLFCLSSPSTGFLCTDGVKTQCPMCGKLPLQILKNGCSSSSTLRRCCLSCFSIFLPYFSLLTLRLMTLLSSKACCCSSFPQTSIIALQQLFGRNIPFLPSCIMKTDDSFGQYCLDYSSQCKRGDTLSTHNAKTETASLNKHQNEAQM